MNRLFIYIGLGLTLGCHSTEAKTREISANSTAGTMLDGRSADPILQDTRHRVEEWDEAARTEAYAAAETLMLSCPYNRVSFQVPVVIDLALQRINPAGLSPQRRADWEALQAGLALHVQTVDAIAGPHRDWPTPRMSDYLDAAKPGTVISRSALLAHPDPVGVTQALIEQVNDLVANYPPNTMTEIGRASDLIGVHTDGAWPLKDSSKQWLKLLQAVRPELSDPKAAQQVDALIALLDLYGSQGC